MYHHTATCYCDWEEMPFKTLPRRSFLQSLWIQHKTKRQQTLSIIFRGGRLSMLLLCSHCSSAGSWLFIPAWSVSSNAHHDTYISQETRKALNITLFTENNSSLRRKVELNAKVTLKLEQLYNKHSAYYILYIIIKYKN